MKDTNKIWKIIIKAHPSFYTNLQPKFLQVITEIEYFATERDARERIKFYNSSYDIISTRCSIIPEKDCNDIRLDYNQNIDKYKIVINVNGYHYNVFTLSENKLFDYKYYTKLELKNMIYIVNRNYIDLHYFKLQE